MANPMRGEVAATINGREIDLRLTLGALAELEVEMGAEGLVDLAERLERGGLRARDVIAVLTAGLRGAGVAATKAEVGDMAFADGAAGAARTALALLRAAFGGGTP